MKSKINKEFLIMVLLLVVIVATIALLFYDYFPLSKDKIKPIEYRADERVMSTIEEIKKNSTLINDEENKLLKTYTALKSELTTNSGEEYEIGKQDPFADVTE